MTGFLGTQKMLLVSVLMLAQQSMAMTQEKRVKLASPACVEAHIRWGKEMQLSYISNLEKNIKKSRVWCSESICSRANIITDYAHQNIDDFPNILKEAIEHFKKNERIFAWYIYTSRYNNLDRINAALIRAGVTKYSPFAAMICFMADVGPLLSMDFFTCERVRGSTQMREWLEIVNEPFLHDQYMQEAYERRITNMLDSEDERYYVGYYLGEPVSIGTLIINHRENYGMLMNIATKAEFRRNGFAQQLIETVLNDAWVSKLTHVVLMAEFPHRGIFERAGFRQVSEIHLCFHN